MTIIVLGFCLVVGLATGIAVASPGIAWGIWRRSAVRGVLSGLAGFTLGFAIGFHFSFSGLEGNAAQGVKCYGCELESVGSKAIIISLASCVIPISTFWASLMRGTKLEPGMISEAESSSFVATGGDSEL